MNFNEFEQVDAAFIARFINSRLPLPFNGSGESLLTAKSTALEETLKSLESEEITWELSTTDEAHTYGRKHAGEIIKLWSVPKKSAEVLKNLVILSKAKLVLEVGTSAGFAALHLGYGASFTGGEVYTIENLADKADLARKHFSSAGLENITLIEAEASQVLSKWDKGPIDMVFLDADKENYGKYLDQLLPLMPVGGIIVADNINDYGHLMEDYLQKVSGTHLPKTRTDHRVRSYYLAALDNGLMITQKVQD